MNNSKNKSQNESLIGKTVSQIFELLQPLGEPEYRARQIYNWIHHRNVEQFQEMSNIPKSVRNILTERFQIKTLHLIQKMQALDGTEKYLWKLADNRLVESVLIPENRRNTICISSQVGCSLGCQFCATGTMGLLRNLSAGEIVEQVLQVKKLSRHQITNVVFMGMGEPFINYQRSIQACQILGDPEAAAVATKKITISTSGVVPKIYQYTAEAHPYGLAISLHAPDQQLREKIMPIARKFPLDQLMESVGYYMKAKKRNRVTFEYVLLAGINDSPIQAKQLIRLLSPFRCKLNLIPCNKNNLDFHPPTTERFDKFFQTLLTAPFAITVRKNRGEEITAACGQLAVDVQEKAIFMKGIKGE
jgi:23S rRNA (adenine2503-C2)-methyltransferase